MAGRAVCARTQNVRMKVLVLGGTQFVGRHIAPISGPSSPQREAELIVRARR